MWSVETLDKRVDRELAKLPRDLIARFLWIADLLTEQGPENVGMPHVRSLSGAGGLWEIRMSGKDGIARAIYVKASGQRLVVVHAFQKKTQKTPKTALETAPQAGEGGNMTKLADLKKEFLSDPDNKAAYDALAPEYNLARKLIAARAAAGLSQAEVAERMGTKQSEISRIEGARQNISIEKLARFADAVGAKLDIRIDPV